MWITQSVLQHESRADLWEPCFGSFRAWSAGWRPILGLWDPFGALWRAESKFGAFRRPLKAWFGSIWAHSWRSKAWIGVILGLTRGSEAILGLFWTYCGGSEAYSEAFLGLIGVQRAIFWPFVPIQGSKLLDLWAYPQGSDEPFGAIDGLMWGICRGWGPILDFPKIWKPLYGMARKLFIAHYIPISKAFQAVWGLSREPGGPRRGSRRTTVSLYGPILGCWRLLSAAFWTSVEGRAQRPIPCLLCDNPGGLVAYFGSEACFWVCPENICTNNHGSSKGGPLQANSSRLKGIFIPTRGILRPISRPYGACPWDKSHISIRGLFQAHMQGGQRPVSVPLHAIHF